MQQAATRIRRLSAHVTVLTIYSLYKQCGLQTKNLMLLFVMRTVQLMML